MEGFNSFFLPQILIADTLTLNIVHLIFRIAMLASFFSFTCFSSLVMYLRSLDKTSGELEVKGGWEI